MALSALQQIDANALEPLDTIVVNADVPRNITSLYYLDGSVADGREGRSGDGFDGNHGERIEVPDAGKADPCDDSGSAGGTSNPASGNPITLGSGNKVEDEVDFESAGEMPLSLHRTYNHFWRYRGLFGKYWVSSYDYSLVWLQGEGIIYVQRPDGRRIKFLRPRSLGPIEGDPRNWFEDKASPVAYIQKQTNGSWILYSEDKSVETYDGAGRAVSIKNAHGIGWNFSYTNNYLSRVTHTNGRYIQFNWTGSQLTQVRAPDGSLFNYTYSANQFGSGIHRLASSATPSSIGNPSKIETYHYENASLTGALTGKSFNGTRYSTFAYDTTTSRATSSEHATGGIDRYTYLYTVTQSAPPPTNPPGDPPPPGATCDPTTHICTPPPEIDGESTEQIAQNALRSADEDAMIDSITAALLTVVETNPLNLQTTYTFTDGQLTNVSGAGTANCASRASSRAYDPNGHVDINTDFNANKTDFDFNTKGQLTKKIDGYLSVAPRTSQYTWDDNVNGIGTVTVLGHSLTTYTYNADKRLSAVSVKNLSSNGTANETHTWTWTYTKYANGILKTAVAKGPDNVAVTYSYDTNGDLTSETNALGHATTYSGYNGMGLPGSVSGPNGDTVSYVYYPGGALKQATTNISGSGTTQYTYSSGLVDTITSPDSITTTYYYDAARRLEKFNRPELNGTAEQRFEYNLNSDRTAVKTYRGTTQRFSSFTDYDDLGRAIKRYGNGSQNFRFSYYPNGNLESSKDSLNRSTSYFYDAVNRLTKITDALLGDTVFQYDAADRIKSVTDPRLLATTYSYDGFGQLWQQNSPDTGTTSFVFAANGRQSSMTRADGVSTTFGYDTIGRLKTVSVSSQTQTLTYDTCLKGIGRLCVVEDSSGLSDYEYNAYGLTTKIHTNFNYPTGAYLGTGTMNYDYDKVGRLTGIHGNGAPTELVYSYSSGQLSGVSYTEGAITTTLASSFSYEPMGPVKSFNYGNGLTRAVGYDADGRRSSTKVSAGATTVENLTYGWNANNLMTSITDGLYGTQSQTYGYDELSRLNSVTSGSGNRTYGYDATGNRIYHTLNNVTTNYTPAIGSNRLNSLSGGVSRTYQHNSNGNITSWTGSNASSFTYDPFNRMKSATKSGLTTNYTLNALGQRKGKFAGNNLSALYIHDPAGNVMMEWEPNYPGWTKTIYMFGEPLALRRSGVIRYIHTDHLGRPEVMTNSSKAVVWRANNFAFDRTVAYDAIGGLKEGYPGQIYDGETGLWHNYMRDYDGLTGRYVESDPIGLGGGMNTFSYVTGNPVTRVDPLGQDGWGYVSPASGSLFSSEFDCNSASSRDPHQNMYGGAAIGASGGFMVGTWIVASAMAPESGGASLGAAELLSLMLTAGEPMATASMAGGSAGAIYGSVAVGAAGAATDQLLGADQGCECK